MITVNINKTIPSKSNPFFLSCNFEIKNKSLVGIFGNSGAGKTTLIKIIAGLDDIDSGSIVVNDNIWQDAKQKIKLSPKQRKVGLVFQDSALFPNMTSLQNLEYALLKNQSKVIIDELIDVLELEDIIDKKPNQLSGGQQQKVALARALVQKPKVLLLDEPLSALDDNIRFKLQNYIIKIHKKYNLTTFLISHNIPEIFKMCDVVLKLKNGQISKTGTPQQVLLQSKLSGKYQTIGHIVQIKKADAVNIVSISTNNSIVKIIATDDEVNDFKVGDKVAVASKAFNPVILKDNF